MKNYKENIYNVAEQLYEDCYDQQAYGRDKIKLLESELSEIYSNFIERPDLNEYVNTLSLEHKAYLFLLLANMSDIEALKKFFAGQEQGNIVDIITHCNDIVFPSIMHSYESEDDQLNTIKYIVSIVQTPETIINLIKAGHIDEICYIIECIHELEIKVTKYFVELYPTEIDWSELILNTDQNISAFQRITDEIFRNSHYSHVTPRMCKEALEFLLSCINITDELLSQRPDIKKAISFIDEYNKAFDGFNKDLQNFSKTCVNPLVTDPLSAEMWTNVLFNLETNLLDESYKSEMIKKFCDKIEKRLEPKENNIPSSLDNSLTEKKSNFVEKLVKDDYITGKRPRAEDRLSNNGSDNKRSRG